MTTSVTDEMAFEAKVAYMQANNAQMGFDASIRAALEAALRSQGKVVSVEKLKALQPYFIDWRYEELEPCEWGSAGTTVVKIDDLTAIIGEGD